MNENMVFAPSDHSLNQEYSQDFPEGHRAKESSNLGHSCRD